MLHNAAPSQFSSDGFTLILAKGPGFHLYNLFLKYI